MRSHSSSSNLHHFYSPGPSRSPKRRSFVPVLPRIRFLSSSRLHPAASSSYSPLKLQFKRSKHEQKRRRRFRYDVVKIKAADDDSVGISSFDDWAVDDSVATIYVGLFINLGLIIFLTLVLLLVDWWGWKIVRLPLAPFYLTSPFFISLILAACAGYVCVPLLKSLKFHQVIRKEGPARHSRKRRTPTMGGLFFIPVGISVAKFVSGSSSIEVSASRKRRTPTMGGLFFIPVGISVAKFVSGSSSIEVSAAAVATLAFGAVGLLDDVLSFIKQHNSGLSPRLRLVLEAAVGIWFSCWLDATSLSSPYGMYIFL
ncbi:Phospho-N-acetylmuramoyl-pentapeptide transferase, conserved site [Corchorus capsularis]|uniref:Phospho-N-acetylmuramoyl-pentapeptide transferase, conserved site n=1 Tax=Corchorus capsularis TaxID=210143 RepID=A0A1R3HJ14_COCAP|nr:Phospho-N-acetylmuramoyl-pentapeptide transferase, conserved site [Corchorus capsularis]